MIVGCLGDVIFIVSSSTVKTLNNIKYSGQASYATHKRHMASSLTEFTGLEPEKITLDVELSSTFGSDPDEEIEVLRGAMEAGLTMPLVIGTKTYGRYRWTITAFNAQIQSHGPGTATVSLTLQEYLL